MARLYSNENFPFPVVAELRRLGHDVLTIQETGLANRKVPDPEVLRYAHAQERALLTHQSQRLSALTLSVCRSQWNCYLYT